MMKKLVSYILIGTMALSMMGCVSQHPNDSTDTSGVEADAKLVATSPAVADICDKLELDLVGVCETSGTIPDRYRDITTVGMAMNPDLEIIKSLNPDYILSPNSLQNDLQPKYSSIGVKSIFVNFVHPMNNSFIEVTLKVLKLLKLTEVNEEHSLNIEFIFFSDIISKFDKSIEVNFLQPKKNPFNFWILRASNFESNDSNLVQLSKKLFIFITEVVLISLKSIELIEVHNLNI